MKSIDNLRTIILSKGHGIGSRSEEFRVILPYEPSGEIGSRLNQIKDWGNLLAPLYERTAEDLSRQFAVLIAEKEFGVFCVAPAKDLFDRRSVVVLGLVADRYPGKDAKLATKMLRRIRGSIPELPKTIRSSPRSELKKAAAVIATEPLPKLGAGSTNLFSQLLQNDSCKGAATPLLLGFGADVIIGTSHEALDAERSGFNIKAYFDIRSGSLRSLKGSDLQSIIDSPGEDKKVTHQKPLRKSKNSREQLEEVIKRIEIIEKEIQSIKDIQKETRYVIKPWWY